MGQIIRPKFDSSRRPRRPEKAKIVARIGIDGIILPKPRAPRTGREARRALQELQGHVTSAACALAYLKAIARSWPDPRAVAALLDDANCMMIGSARERRKAMFWLAEFLAEVQEK